MEQVQVKMHLDPKGLDITAPAVSGEAFHNGVGAREGRNGDFGNLGLPGISSVRHLGLPGIWAGQASHP